MRMGILLGNALEAEEPWEQKVVKIHSGGTEPD